MNPHSSLYRNIVDIIPLMTFTLLLHPSKAKSSGTMCACNSLTQQFLGYSEMELKRKDFRIFQEILHPNDFQVFKEATHLFALGIQTKHEAIYRIRSKNHKDFIPVQINSSMVYTGNNGKEIHTFNIINLVSDCQEKTTYTNNRNTRILMNRLTQRNIEFARLIVAGKTVEETARLLHVSIPTVKWQRGEIRKKLEIDNHAKLLLFLNDAGL